MNFVFLHNNVFYIFIMLFFCWLCSSCVVFFLDASCWCCFPHVILFFAWWCSCSSLCFFVVLFVCCYYSLSISVAILLVMVLSFPHVGTWYIPFFALLYFFCVLLHCFSRIVMLFFSHCCTALFTLVLPHYSFYTTTLLFSWCLIVLLALPCYSSCVALFFSHSYTDLSFHILMLLLSHYLVFFLLLHYSFCVALVVFLVLLHCFPCVTSLLFLHYCSSHTSVVNL